MRAIAALGLVAILGVAGGAQQVARPAQAPTRDTSAAPSKDAPPPTGSIIGRVVAADSGRPIKRARVSANAAELQGGRSVLTDDKGTFELVELPAGRYTVNVSKSGFVNLSYGQRRPFQPGTPLQIADGQQMKGIDFSLPRGSVITGTVLDEDGDAMPGVNVRVMRYQFQQGQRRLVPSGNGQTDDRGQYRIWGLMPGDYYVDATARNFNFGGGRGAAALAAGRGGRGGPVAAAVAGALANAGTPGAGDDDESLAYAPTYYPGVAAIDEAKAVTVGLSQEVVGINFNVLLVRTARVSGRVTNPDGSPATGGNVNLASDSGRAQAGSNFGGRIGGDGSFAIANVPPGRYVVRARGIPPGAGRGGNRGQGAELPPLLGSLSIVVSGQDLDSVTIQLANGATLSGIIVFPPGADPSQSRVNVTAPSLDPDVFGGPQPTGRVDKDGKFTIAGIAEGSHLIRAGGPGGWTMKSVSIGGRDVTDAPVALRSGQALSDVTIVFTDRVSEVTGTLANAQNAPAPEYTVLVFPADSSLWRPQARQIQTTRPDQTGKFRFRALPPGDYYVVAVDPAEPGEWFDPAYLEAHKTGATRFTLGEGQTLTQDLRLR